MPLRSWLSSVSQTATSGTLVTPSVITIIPVNNKQRQLDEGRRSSWDAKVLRQICADEQGRGIITLNQRKCKLAPSSRTQVLHKIHSKYFCPQPEASLNAPLLLLFSLADCNRLTCTGVTGQQLQCQNSLPNHADKSNISSDHGYSQLPPWRLLGIT